MADKICCENMKKVWWAQLKSKIDWCVFQIVSFRLIVLEVFFGPLVFRLIRSFVCRRNVFILESQNCCWQSGKVSFETLDNILWMTLSLVKKEIFCGVPSQQTFDQTSSVAIDLRMFRMISSFVQKKQTRNLDS